MKRCNRTGRIIRFINTVAVFLCLMVTTGCERGLDIQVVFEARHGIQPGAKVMMNDVPIGQVAEVTLRTSKESLLKVEIDDQYRDLLNSTTVFSYDADPADRNKNCLICKNCLENAAPVTPGQEFKGMGILKYAVVCLSSAMDGGIRQTLETEIRKTVESGEQFSAEALKVMQELAVTNREAFEQALKDAGNWIDQLDAEARRNLDEIRLQSAIQTESTAPAEGLDSD